MDVVLAVAGLAVIELVIKSDNNLYYARRQKRFLFEQTNSDNALKRSNIF